MPGLYRMPYSTVMLTSDVGKLPVFRAISVAVMEHCETLTVLVVKLVKVLSLSF